MGSTLLRLRLVEKKRLASGGFTSYMGRQPQTGDGLLLFNQIYGQWHKYFKIMDPSGCTAKPHS